LYCFIFLVPLILFWNFAAISGANCNRFQFECVNKEDPSLAECVAVYDRCNGIAQCRDESDELLCSEEQRSIHSAESEKPRSNSDQEVRQYEKLDGQRVLPMFVNSTSTSLTKSSSVVRNDQNRFQFDSGEVAGLPSRGNSKNQVLSKTADRSNGNSELSAKNTEERILLGKQDADGNKLDQQADVNADRFEGTDRFVKSSTLHDDAYPGYSIRKNGRFSHNMPERGEVLSDRNNLSGPNIAEGGSKADEFVGSDQTPNRAFKANANTLEDSREKQDVAGSRFASTRGKQRLGTEDLSTGRVDSHSLNKPDNMQKLKTDDSAENLKSKIDSRYRIKGLPVDTNMAKMGSKAENGEALTSRDYLGNSGKTFKSTERYRNKSAMDEPSSSEEDERHHLSLLNHQIPNGHLLEQYSSHSKEQKYGSLEPEPVLSSSDSQYENLRGRSSVPDSASSSKFVNPKMRTYENKHADELPDDLKSSIRGGSSQSQWLEDDKLQNTGSPELHSDQYRSYVDMEAKPSRDKDNVKAAKLHDADLPVQTDLSETVLRNRVRPLRPLRIQDTRIDDRLDKESDQYQDHGELTLRGKAGGRYQPLDQNERSSDPSLDRYSANIVAGSNDRAGQMYGYGGRYNDADTISDRYIDGPVDSAMPYDGVRAQADLSGQPVSRGQFYGYGRDGYGHDAYGDNAYSADDYIYGGMARQPSQGYGHSAGSASDYDYFGVGDRGR